MHNTKEPPIPKPEHYGRSYDAARRTRWGRARRALSWLDRHPGWIASGAVVAVSAVPVYVVVHENRAVAAGDRAAVVAKPNAVPGVPIRTRGPEYSPPVPDRLTGDGMWIVGKQMKPGVYQSNAGASCYWERLAGLSGKYEDLLDNGGFRRGPKLVEVLGSDFAFTSQGCGEWVMVR